MNFESDKLWNKNGVTGEFTGIQGGSGTTKSFFSGADDKSGTNAKFFAQADGKIFHDSIGGVISASSTQSAFGKNPSSAAFPTNEWSVEVAESSDGDHFEERIIRRLEAKKRFGITKLILRGQAKTELVEGGSPPFTGHAPKIQLEVSQGGLRSTFDVPLGQTTYQPFTLELDISGVDDGTLMLINVKIRSELTISSGNSSTFSTETFLLERMTLEQQT